MSTTLLSLMDSSLPLKLATTLAVTIACAFFFRSIIVAFFALSNAILTVSGISSLVSSIKLSIPNDSLSSVSTAKTWTI